MRRLYTGLLFFGASFAAHAGESHKHPHASKASHAQMHYTQYVAETPPHDSVLYDQAARSDTTANLPRLGSTDHSAADLARSRQNLIDVLSALYAQRIHLHGEQMDASFSPGAAMLETEHVKVAVRSGSTSITWHEAF